MNILEARIHLGKRKQSYSESPDTIPLYSNGRQYKTAPVTEQHYLDKALVSVARGTLEVIYSTGSPPEWFQTSTVASEDWDDPKNPTKWVMNIQVTDKGADQIYADSVNNLDASRENAFYSGTIDYGGGTFDRKKASQDDLLGMYAKAAAGRPITSGLSWTTIDDTEIVIDTAEAIMDFGDKMIAAKEADWLNYKVKKGQATAHYDVAVSAQEASDNVAYLAALEALKAVIW